MIFTVCAFSHWPNFFVDASLPSTLSFHNAIFVAVATTCKQSGESSERYSSSDWHQHQSAALRVCASDLRATDLWICVCLARYETLYLVETAQSATA